MLFGQHVASKIEFTTELLDFVEQQYGDNALARVMNWRTLISDARSKNIDDQLFVVNRFFNQVDFVDDIEHWKRQDYWATPVEFLGTNGGDCEDFTIAKYFTLRELGVPIEKMRLIYVTATRLNQAHMVLGYYETPTSIPLILDNLNKRILPASSRRDLRPIYSFNGDGLWLAKSQGNGRKVQSANNNALWADLNKRMQQGSQ